MFPIERLKTELKVVLPKGFYTVMVLTGHEVGSASAYAQMNLLNRVRDENTRVSADEDSQRPYTAAWEPKPNQMRKV